MIYPFNNKMISSLQPGITALPVMEHFYTLQGEGFHQGKAAYFIRLGGCDVGCVWCDVKESWDANNHPQMSITEIVKEAAQNSSSFGGKQAERRLGTKFRKETSIVVITGGEPFLHDLTTLTAQLKANGFRTHVETSGSATLSGAWDWITLSPKKFKAPLPENLIRADELKIVVFNKSDFQWAEQYAAQVSAQCKLYLQPEWSKAALVTPLIVDYIKAHPQWQLSLQIHKYINVP